jgi:manganese oxidase
MLGFRSALNKVVVSFAAITLTLLIASVIAAQTPTTSLDKPASDANSLSPVAEPKVPTTPAAITTAETPKTTAEPIRTETEPAKENAAAPAAESAPAAMQVQACPPGSRLIKADVVAIPHSIMLNRLGAAIPNGIVFALRSDTIPSGGTIQLRPHKRPRPITLRANVGDCLRITLSNEIPAGSIGTPEVSLHIQGQEWATGPSDDGSFVGKNNSSLASPSPLPTPTPSPMPPKTQTYVLFVKNEGTFLLYSMGDTEGNETGDQIGRGLFGALNVQPQGAEWYRSQVTQQDLALATTGTTTQGQPIINYSAVYPAGSTYPDGTSIPANTPILKMLDANNNIVHSDLTAIITGPNAGRFPGSTGVNNPEPPCNSANNGAGATNPLFCANPSAPDRKQPYREITIIYHEVGQIATQAFPVFSDPSLRMISTVNAGFDGFAINYGTGGIGAEVYANRIGVGPMGNCIDCKFEEFFLSAWSVGDPAMLVDRPANSSVLPAFTTLPAQPPVPSKPPPPVLCTAAQLGDTGAPPDPNCANARVPVPGAVNGFPYSLAPLVKATKAYYPDDPSNVYHSYINDHTKFRIHHGGTVATHVHHQHAHQWLQSPNSDEGAYLDSQMISPGASYTLEMTFNGSGNRNKVVGDSIFHCHFYPHFAAGMWAMWRTHDTFELGSQLNANGIPVTGTRALPDGEIKAGTPTPAVVPMPTLPMAPMPSPVFINNTNGQVVYGTPAAPDPTGANVTVNPGFPFFIPGVAGARAPHPPLDFAPDGAGGFMDGGLPRHVITGGTVAYEKHDQFDWSKDLATMTAQQLPEAGTNVEKVAMKFFGVRCRPSFFPDGTVGACPSTPVTSPNMTQNVPPKGFLLNGLPMGPQMGAPFADPAVDDDGKAINVGANGQQLKRVYKAAAIQLNVTLNKKGWHFPQQRILALWNDVKPTLAYTPGGSGRAPEPLFFRGNSGDIVEYWHTNLVPNYYLVDDFQVRTPTDILGQHIHLVKFDVTASDGAGNGFNYEDGTFSPDEVREIIHAIKAPGGNWTACPGCPTATLAPKPPPAEICAGPNPPSQCANEWMGAQTTVQRWYLDPVVNSQNVDRTLRTVFTHDHFGPSTHQQAGLYAGLVVEPKDSVWRSADDGAPMGGGTITTPPVRPDGGPTSWQANIITASAADSYREFVLEFQDLQLAYAQGSRSTPDPAKNKGWRDASFAVNPTVFPEFGQVMPRLVSTGNENPITGTQSINYYNEPIAWRLGQFKDLSYAFDNQTALAVNPNFPNVQNPNPDPLTPLMRAYQGDNVQVRTLVGAHVFAHQFNLAGPTWFAEPSWKNSGYRSNQPMGLSEHFELLFKVPSSSAPIPVAPATTVRKCPDGTSSANCVDYFYSPSLDETGIAHGMWGIFRSYDPTVMATRLQPLPNNTIAPTNNVSYATCPANLPASQRRTFNITAVTSQKALSNQSIGPGELVFNSHGQPPGYISTLNGVLYVRSEDLDPNGVLRPGVAVEPLILRANAGDCIDINLTNKIDPSSRVFSHNFQWPAPFNITVPSTSSDGTQVPAYNSKMSGYVGLHPQLLGYDAASSFGMNVGWNSKGRADQFANFNETVKYRWYAGKIDRGANGSLAYTPVEFGTLNLFPSDPLFQHPNGVFGQMIIEPAGSTWQCGEAGALRPCDPSGGAPPTSRASASVSAPNGVKFREFSIMLSDALITSNATPVEAINYRTEPSSQRFVPKTTDFSCMTSNLLTQPPPIPPPPGPQPSPTPIGEPQTPIFTAAPGDQVRFRMSHPFGTGNSEVFTIHGHNWQRNPYQKNSTVIAPNNLSQWMGSRDNHGSSDHFDLVIPSAGGTFKRPGDYLYTAYLPEDASAGAWGIFRVGNPPNPTTGNGRCVQTTGGAQPKVISPTEDLLKRFRRQPLNASGKP